MAVAEITNLIIEKGTFFQAIKEQQVRIERLERKLNA